MSILKKLAIIACLCVSLSDFAQTSALWGNLNCPLKYFPNRAYYDTIQNKLFMSATDSSGIGVVVSWDGATWAQMSAAPCSCTMSFIQYNGEVLLGNSSANSILKWNGTNWIPFTAILPDAGVNCFLQDGTDLYVGGNFNTVGGSPIRNIAKWDGLSWSAV